MHIMNRVSVRRAVCACLFLATTALGPSASLAQQPARGPRPGEVETAPIRCWWKTDTTEVRIGRRFVLTLTCGVIETRSLKVIANTNSLDPGAVQLTPFEVASGVRREDILSPPWRYFQYEYQVRLLGEGFFGQEVTLPPVNVTYNIQAASGDGAQGRDQSYALPALPLRVASLVPRGASDIRDVSNEGFASIEARRLRASTATVIGGILIAFALVLVILAMARAFGRVRNRRPVINRPLTAMTTLSAALRTLAQTRAAVAHQGWSPALVRQALAAMRVAAAAGVGRPVAQALVGRDAVVREGQLVVRRGWLRPRRVMISAATTSSGVAKALSEAPESLRRSRGALERLAASLQTFGSAAYGRADALDTIALDRALSESRDAIKQLRLRSLLPFGQGQTNGAPIPGLAAASMTGDRA